MDILEAASERTTTRSERMQDTGTTAADSSSALSSELTLAKQAIACILDGQVAEVVVAEALRQARLDSIGRGFFARRVLGTSILRLALAYQAKADSAEALLSAYMQFVERNEPWPRPWPDDPMERLIAEGSCPRIVADELVRSMGVDGATAFLRASNIPGPRTLRANTLRINRDDLREQLKREGVQTRYAQIAPNALHVAGPANLFGSAAWRAGLFEMQDEASQLVVDHHTPAAPDQIVVDLCAGRGGKTLALAARMRNRGSLFVYDTDPRTRADMKVRLTRSGVTCVKLGLPPEGTADIVLIDAPCSALGPLRRSPDRRYTLTVEELAALAPVQTELLAVAARLVRPGGTVTYATCTVRKEENEDIADSNPLTLREEHRYFPHVHGTDGFYVAVLENGARGNPPRKEPDGFPDRSPGSSEANTRE